MQNFENKWKITTKMGSEGTEKALIEGIQEKHFLIEPNIFRYAEVLGNLVGWIFLEPIWCFRHDKT